MDWSFKLFAAQRTGCAAKMYNSIGLVRCTQILSTLLQGGSAFVRGRQYLYSNDDW
jgi:hypothetical protein